MEISAAESVPDKQYELLIEGTVQARPCKHVDAFETLLVEHKKAWERYWEISDIIIDGDDKAQQAIRYNIYQLRISVSSHDSRYSMAAKGLTGFGYRGHIFHDTEIFMLPYFTYVHPDIARNLLMYRYRLLPGARAKAKQNGYEGAQYPWESRLDRGETTPDAIVHPESGELIPVLNGRLELHITASIAHAFWQYWQITGDDEFMREYVAEILLSTAEFWGSRVEWHPEREDYEISDVIGPDEWHEHVNNNAFTNYMARWNIQIDLDALKWLQSADPNKAEELTQQLDLNEKRLTHWRDVIARMRIPQDKQTGLIEQFDGFFQLEPLDQEKYKGRTTSYQGLLGVEQVKRYRIVKQADVLMLLTVLDQQFDLKTKKVNWDYYFPITDHDYGSSLTPALHVILACELGFIETRHGSILCDPWFNPAYFASWFPFPSNENVDLEKISRPTYLYISHLHHDHFDPQFLREHVWKDATVLLPDYPLNLLERRLRELGFPKLFPPTNGQAVEVDGLRFMIMAMVAPIHVPLGDSSLVVDDGE